MSLGTKDYSTIPGLAAQGDLSAGQYKLVQLASTAGRVKLATGGTDNIVGVLMNDPAATGVPAEVACIGVVKVAAEASVSAGAHLTSNSTGQAQATTTANDNVIGIAITASTDAGDLITAVIGPASNY